MLILNKYSKEDPFDAFKNIVKGTLGLQMFRASEYSIREARGGLFTVCFNSRKVTMKSNQLKKAWELIYKDCIEYGLGDPTYVKDYMPEPCIHNNTLIFRIQYYDI